MTETNRHGWVILDSMSRVSGASYVARVDTGDGVWLSVDLAGRRYTDRSHHDVYEATEAANAKVEHAVRCVNLLAGVPARVLRREGLTVAEALALAVLRGELGDAKAFVRLVVGPLA